jgi:hypothetical protein
MRAMKKWEYTETNLSFLGFQCRRLGGRGRLAPGEAEEEVVLFSIVSGYPRRPVVAKQVETYHGEDGGEDLDLLGCGGDVVVPVVVCGEEVEHKLRVLLVSALECSLLGESVIP